MSHVYSWIPSGGFSLNQNKQLAVNVLEGNYVPQSEGACVLFFLFQGSHCFGWFKCKANGTPPILGFLAMRQTQIARKPHCGEGVDFQLRLLPVWVGVFRVPFPLQHHPETDLCSYSYSLVLDFIIFLWLGPFYSQCLGANPMCRKSHVPQVCFKGKNRESECQLRHVLKHLPKGGCRGTLKISSRMGTHSFDTMRYPFPGGHISVTIILS